MAITTHFKRKRLALATLLASSGVGLPATYVIAQEASGSTQQQYAIGAQPLLDALIQFGREAGLQVSVEDALVRGKRSPGVNGVMTVSQAAEILLKGSGLIYRINGNLFTVIAPKEQATLMLDPVRVESTAEARFGDAPVEPGGFKAEYQTTATKMALPLKETPQAISVVTQESLQSRQASDIFTALETTAGIGSKYFGHPGPFAGNGQSGFINSFSIRGQELSGDRDIRADGFALGEQTNHDLAIYERVEVIRGPSGFYGQGSLGGFINMTRKKPQAEFNSSISAQLGSYDTYRGEFDVTGALDDNEKIKGRLIAVHADAGSFVDHVETKRSILAPSLEIQLGDKTRALIQMLYQKEEFIPNLGMPLRLKDNRYKALNLSRSFYFGVPNESSEVETLNTSLRLDHELNDNWLASLLLQGEKVDRDNVLGNYGYGIYTGDTTYLSASRDDIEQEFWSGELRLNGSFNWLGQKHNILTGIEANHRESIDQGGYAALGYVALDNIASFRSLRRDELPIEFGSATISKNQAAYGQIILSLREHTKLLAGVRYDRANQTSSDPFANTKDNKINRAWTTRLGLSHEFTPNITAYTTYAESFNPVTEKARDNKILDPERGIGYELGLKTEWFDKRLGVNLAIYQQDLENSPVEDPNNGPGQDFSISDGLFRNKGIELEVNGTPYPGLTISAAFSLLDSDYLDLEPGDDNYGKVPQGTIKRQYSLHANYEFQKGTLEGLGAGVTLVSSGEVASRNYQGGESQPYIDGYERVDLNFSYNGLPNWDVALQIRNIFDSTYIEKARGGGWGNYFGSPRAALLKATYHF